MAGLLLPRFFVSFHFRGVSGDHHGTESGRAKEVTFLTFFFFSGEDEGTHKFLRFCITTVQLVVEVICSLALL